MSIMYSAEEMTKIMEEINKKPMEPLTKEQQVKAYKAGEKFKKYLLEEREKKHKQKAKHTD